MNNYPPNFIPKGHYDQNIYRKQYDDHNNENTENSYGVFKDNFKMSKFVPGDRVLTPLDIKTVRYPNNKPHFSYDAISLLQDDISEMFHSFDQEKINNIINLTEKTHNNELDESYDPNGNRNFKMKRINEYTDKPDFLDNNVNGTKEVINEYIININSVDRDCITYPNPFSYRVLFNPADTNNAYITRVFKNIKYINLKSAIVPNKYCVIKKNITLKSDDQSAFINLFTNKQPNQQICIYAKHKLKMTNTSGISFYTYYYKINNDYLLTYDIYLDENYKQKLNIQILVGGDSNDKIIDDYLADPIVNHGFIMEDIAIEINSFILIDKNDNKIKFSSQNNNFNDIIDKTFEFEYNINSTLINRFNVYILIDNLLSNDRYLLLNVKEIDTNYEYATDQNTENAFAILFPDYFTDYYYYLDSSHHEKVYDHGTLGNITKMTINFQNSSGDDIKVNYRNIIDYDIKTPKNKCICEYDQNTGDRIRNYQCSHSYLRHMGYEKLQNTLLFKVGVLEGIQDIQHI
jgi:hypothetical protein